MPLPPQAFTVQGGCNCGAVRYKLSIPPVELRPSHPNADPSDPVQLPMIVTDHCNDCRRATGSFLPAWICAPSDMVLVSLIPRSDAAANPDFKGRQPQFNQNRNELVPSEQVFKVQSECKGFLSYWESSSDRWRWFCGRCGTSLAYTAVMPPDFPSMLDIVLGTVDRDDLDEKDYLIPDRQLWWNFGINWIRKLSVSGLGTIPRHPIYKVDEYTTQGLMREALTED